jgi:hypothetical protein
VDAASIQGHGRNYAENLLLGFISSNEGTETGAAAFLSIISLPRRGSAGLGHPDFDHPGGYADRASAGDHSSGFSGFNPGGVAST